MTLARDLHKGLSGWIDRRPPIWQHG